MEWASPSPTRGGKTSGRIYSRGEESQPHTRPPSQGFQCGEVKSSQLLAAKNQQGLS